MSRSLCCGRTTVAIPCMQVPHPFFSCASADDLPVLQGGFQQVRRRLPHAGARSLCCHVRAQARTLHREPHLPALRQCGCTISRAHTLSVGSLSLSLFFRICLAAPGVSSHAYCVYGVPLQCSFSPRNAAADAVRATTAVAWLWPTGQATTKARVLTKSASPATPRQTLFGRWRAPLFWSCTKHW